MDENVRDLRSRRRLELQSHVQRVALRLFAERGFERTTVDDIAEEAGISQRTFFRHFATKEDTVLFEADSMVAKLERIDVSAGDSAAILRALEEVYSEMAGRLTAPEDSLSAQAQLLIATTPVLREAATRKHRKLMDTIRQRLTETEAPDASLLGRLLIEISTATLHAALDEWAASGGERTGTGTYDRARVLLRELI